MIITQFRRCGTPARPAAPLSNEAAEVAVRDSTAEPYSRRKGSRRKFG